MEEQTALGRRRLLGCVWRIGLVLEAGLGVFRLFCLVDPGQDVYILFSPDLLPGPGPPDRQVLQHGVGQIELLQGLLLTG